MFINFICHQSFNVILSYVVQELSLGYLFLVTILPFPSIYFNILQQAYTNYQHLWFLLAYKNIFTITILLTQIKVYCTVYFSK